MLEMITDSWEFLIPLLALSLYSIALIFGKYRWLQQNTLKQSAFNKIWKSLQGGHIREAYELVEKPSLEKKLMGRAINSLQKNRQKDLQEELADRARHELYPFASDLHSFSSLANLATLLGLLGTVVGMIIAFYKLKETGESDPYVLAGGISKAMITTAAGLLIAIPLMFAQNVFQRSARQKEENLLQLISFFHHLNSEKRS